MPAAATAYDLISPHRPNVPISARERAQDAWDLVCEQPHAHGGDTSLMTDLLGRSVLAAASRMQFNHRDPNASPTVAVPVQLRNGALTGLITVRRQPNGEVTTTGIGNCHALLPINEAGATVLRRPPTATGTETNTTIVFVGFDRRAGALIDACEAYPMLLATSIHQLDKVDLTPGSRVLIFVQKGQKKRGVTAFKRLREAGVNVSIATIDEIEGMPKTPAEGTALVNLMTNRSGNRSALRAPIKYVSLSAAREELKAILTDVAASIQDGLPVYVAIKASAGVGKSYAILALAQACADAGTPLKILYLAPNHDLLHDLEKRAEEMGLAFRIHRGKTFRPSEDDPAYCDKETNSGLVSLMRANGIGQESHHLCKTMVEGELVLCPSLPTCKWRNQWAGVDYSTTIVGATTHAIFSGGHPDWTEGTFDLIVIDERIWDIAIPSKAIQESAFLPKDLRRNDYDVGSELVKALKFREPILTALSAAGIDAERVAGYASALNPKLPTIRPNWSDSKVERQLNSAKGERLLAYAAIKALHEHMVANPTEKDATFLSVDEGKDGVKVVWNPKAERHEKWVDTSIVAIDADLDKSIHEYVLGKKSSANLLWEYHDIAVERNATVVQVNDKSLSYASLESAEALADITRSIIKHADLHKKLLVIVPLKVEKRLATMALPANVQVTHFNAIRGRDDWKECDAVIVFGRNHPRLDDIEIMATALTGVRVRSPRDCGQIGVRQARDVETGDGDDERMLATVHPEPVAQALLEQVRECETLQGADRVRPAARTGEDRPTIYIACNLPLPGIKVDRFISWNAFCDKTSGYDAYAIDRLDRRLAVPASVSGLMSVEGSPWPTKEAAKSALKRSTVVIPAIRTVTATAADDLELDSELDSPTTRRPAQPTRRGFRLASQIKVADNDGDQGGDSYDSNRGGDIGGARLYISSMTRTPIDLVVMRYPSKRGQYAVAIHPIHQWKAPPGTTVTTERPSHQIVMAKPPLPTIDRRGDGDTEQNESNVSQSPSLSPARLHWVTEVATRQLEEMLGRPLSANGVTVVGVIPARQYAAQTHESEAVAAKESVAATGNIMQPDTPVTDDTAHPDDVRFAKLATWDIEFLAGDDGFDSDYRAYVERKEAREAIENAKPTVVNQPPQTPVTASAEKFESPSPRRRTPKPPAPPAVAPVDDDCSDYRPSPEALAYLHRRALDELEDGHRAFDAIQKALAVTQRATDDSDNDDHDPDPSPPPTRRPRSTWVETMVPRRRRCSSTPWLEDQPSNTSPALRPDPNALVERYLRHRNMLN